MGLTPCPGDRGRPPPIGRAPISWAPWWASGVHLLIHHHFYPKKIVGKLTGRNSAATRRNLGRINLGLWRSYSVGDTSLWEGEIITNVIINDPIKP